MLSEKMDYLDFFIHHLYRVSYANTRKDSDIQSWCHHTD